MMTILKVILLVTLMGLWFGVVDLVVFLLTYPNSIAVWGGVLIFVVGVIVWMKLVRLVINLGRKPDEKF